MKRISIMALFAMLLSANCFAETPVVPTEDPVHNELRALRAEVISAITQGDFDKLLTFIHPNVVITWQNNEVCRGHKGLAEFMNRMGKEAFRSYKLPPTPDELTIFYGNTGVSFGKTVAVYKVLGKEFEVTSRWTATLVKENGHWLLAAYHVSTNALDNPLLSAAKQALYWTGGIAGLLGLVFGWLFGVRRAKRKAGNGL